MMREDTTRLGCFAEKVMRADKAANTIFQRSLSISAKGVYDEVRRWGLQRTHLMLSFLE